jgi:YD repeat-containing protein
VGLTDPLGYTTRLTLDLLHRPTARTDGNDCTAQVVYNSLGNIQVSLDELGYPVTNSYDGAGNWIGTFNTLGQRTTRQYDAYSRPIAYYDELGNPSLSVYNGLGQLWYETNALGGAVTYSYDVYGRFQSIQDEAGNLTQTSYNSFGQYAGTCQRRRYNPQIAA